MAGLGFGPLTLTASFPVSMSGSGRSFTAYVFLRGPSPLPRALAAAGLCGGRAAAAAKDEGSAPPATGRLPRAALPAATAAAAAAPPCAREARRRRRRAGLPAPPEPPLPDIRAYGRSSRRSLPPPPAALAAPLPPTPAPKVVRPPTPAPKKVVRAASAAAAPSPARSPLVVARAGVAKGKGGFGGRQTARGLGAALVEAE